jgi:hypothetical protein
MPGAKTSTNFSLFLCVCFSVLGLAMLPFVLYQSVKFQVNFPQSSFLIGSLYSLVNTLGIVAVYYPKKCQNTFSYRKNVALQENSQLGKCSDVAFEGHHPNCRKFDGNRTKILGVVLCSACTGLFLGAILALIGAALYFFFGTNFPLADIRILLVASVAMLLGMVQFVFRNYLKWIINSLFVVSSLIILVSADSIGRNLFIDLYVLGLIVFLLLTRIMLSEWNNRKTCFECGSCKSVY